MSNNSNYGFWDFMHDHAEGVGIIVILILMISALLTAGVLAGRSRMTVTTCSCSPCKKVQKYYPVSSDRVYNVPDWAKKDKAKEQPKPWEGNYGQ